ncbi:MG2 domain-containing protein [uncultured Algibacter sp.]|uniref:alpha-2-macroglobulin family protein n=1 Tax=uncultured Algibacter sp. TaxID=298659 RepID=UPI003217FF44
MKQTLSLIVLILFANFSNAQPPNYKLLWDQVEKFETDGLPKSALNIIEDISAKAQIDKNAPQLIKTMLFKSKYALVLEEDAQLNIINNFKEHIKTSEFPTKNILESILANLYWQYFNRNRWQFYNRTKTAAKVDAIDFRTWDLQTLFNEIHAHYQNSLQNGLMLQQENLNQYHVLLNEQKDSKIYRPTLFDFLNHNALAFYKTNETHITKPAYKFKINDKTFLADAKTFSTVNIVSQDSTSLQLNALKIYKNLTRFHLKSNAPLALANINIERLKFVKQHTILTNKETQFLDVLKAERNLVKSHKASALYDFEIATLYYQKSQTYKPSSQSISTKTNEDNRWKTKEALAICNAVISKFPESKSALNCAVLMSQIKNTNLQITIENYIPIQKNARILIDYKNLDVLQFKIYKISEREFDKFNEQYRKEEQLAYINKLTSYKSWDSKLRNEKDYQQHTTELLLPKLDSGRYLITAFDKNNDNTFAFSNIQITNLAIVETETPRDKMFQVIDRNTGKPYINAEVTLSYRENSSRKTLNKTLITNSLGHVSFEKNHGWYSNVKLTVKHNDNVAFFGNYYINQHYKDNAETLTYKSFLFTDRSIYRPGQAVFFKGIAMKTEHGTSQVLNNYKVNATLFNVNGEKLKTLDFKTNKFGSISGEFILPNNGLNGQYSIEFDSQSKGLGLSSRVYFSVEDYKRPKFETKFNPITETFKINDSITIKGKALAFAGSTITDAKVVYRVHRKVQYPRWYFWYRPWVNSAPQEITHGESTTNDKGEFEIIFKALPDESVDKSSLPIFNYEITADVTDLNGETRSATTIVNVGYHALTANIVMDNLLDKTNKDQTLHIDTKNLNGEFVAANGTIKIYKLNAPNTVLRQRPWPAPDYQDFSQDTFKELFPHDAYGNEQNPDYWDKGTLVLETSFDTKKSKTIKLGKLKKWESGQYLVTLKSKDIFGQPIKDETKFTLYSNDDKTLADHQLFNITTDKPLYNIGDIVEITLASAAKNLTVTATIEKNKKIIKTEIITLNNNKHLIKVPVTKDDLGGFAIHYSFGFANDFQLGQKIINVPYPKTDLNIETTTFRDKLQPGTDETWAFKIKGPKGEQVSAELLASMYDASLDQFKPHSWNFDPNYKPTFYASINSNANQSFGIQNFRVHRKQFHPNYTQQTYDQLNWFGLYFGNVNNIRIRRNSNASKALSGKVSGIRHKRVAKAHAPLLMESENNEEDVEVAGYRIQKKSKVTDSIISTNIEQPNSEEKPNFDNIKIRKNLNETAFFFPQLKTDNKGNVSFSFTTPEALTQWKLQLLSHTKTLESATKTLTAVTQKELMVIPNAPRFLREGDKISISTKISNLTDQPLSGEAALILTDAISGKDINANLNNLENNKTFIVDATGNTQVSWSLNIPEDIQAVQYKVVAKAGNFSDGEQNVLPVLSNRMLVTETLPMWVRSNQTKTFTLNKLKTNTSTTLKNHKLTLEMTSNPAWYAVQALPYLMEYPHDCNEQTFSRYYANTLASHIANSNPRIQEVFNQWRNTDALISNLEKNEALKSILIQETPWLRDAQSETEQKKRIALLFDLNKMNNEQQSAIRKLKNNQMDSGAWAWFNGGRANRYITQHIITGFGHLKHLNVSQNNSQESQMITKAMTYLDAQFVKEYRDIKKYDATIDLNKDHLSYSQLHYLYMRSFFPDIKKSKQVKEITQYYQTQIQKYWLSRSLYSKGLMALISHKGKDSKTTLKILKSLKETSITSEALGMYWKANTNSWYWYQAPIETQSLLIEVFSEAGNTIQSDIKNLETIDNLKIWLLKNKQTNRWKTTKATTEAVYALLLQGSDWLNITDMVDVVLGNQQIDSKKLEDVNIEAVTGYYKTSWHASEIKPEMGDVKITKKGKGIAWGSLYWQYFEDLDKITSAETPLKLKKKLFLKKNTATGEQILEIKPETNLKLGDLVRVRIELRSDRPMEFLYMKDMRASGLEPINVLSQYKWQDGLGYYESTKDASTNFFFDYLPKGIYVFEYDLRVNNAGNMSNGITTIQSMYAPEFSSHSEGLRISIN